MDTSSHSPAQHVRDFIVVGSVAYYLAKVRARRELEIQKLKAQVDELKEELSSTLALTGTLTIELSGPGPFELPLLNQLNWLVPTRQTGYSWISIGSWEASLCRHLVPGRRTTHKRSSRGAVIEGDIIAIDFGGSCETG